MSSPTPSICVFCGARAGNDPAFVADAKAFGGKIAQKQWRLVYGAGDVGLMGEVARACMAAGGDTFGVIPTHLMQGEVAKRDLRTLVVTETMHERKKVMFSNSDAVVVLPGGAGSLDEFFEVLTWRQLGLHARPIFILNTGGYWTPLAALIDNIIAQGFADPSLRGFFTLCDSVDEVVKGLDAALAD
ncbi:Cytokinin riboside 5'-monophosphate phosphoribohydrolase [Roseibaca ekhonensis]|jgi:uncharacterized protein (TIGR00730 family)|uniref:Cytokinin riboside 5'-monophosphate phosphoribohydrolase n=1 Tax=Roseinatronobacter ekhonensis TaxID=254356 RepID=A0A3B0M7X4_9RHOB|nr:TIGR00730 family Rossman fold protein [Roseibaca ekhonensis]SUZ32081.1 Cytokinin riboside 5'-monophosphate phosphoribohydrolase [Roseibaca ekhonensis]